MSRLLREGLVRYQGLLIIDNAEDEGDVRLLLPPPTGQCRVIVTARDSALLHRLTNSDPIQVDLFSPGEAEACFAEWIGDERVKSELDDVHTLCGLLENLPLAVDAAARTIASEKLSVAAWLAAYPNERNLLEELSKTRVGEADLPDEEARRRRIVGAVLRMSLKNLDPIAAGLLASVACFDSAGGGSEEMIIQVADAGVEAATAGLELNRLRLRSILRESTFGGGGTRYTLHRLMRRVVIDEWNGPYESSRARCFAQYAAFPELLSRLVSDNRSSDAHRAFNHESANLDAVAQIMAMEEGVPESLLEEMPRLRAEFAAHLAQFALFAWPRDLMRVLLENGSSDGREGGWGWLEANTLKALGDLERREDHMVQARTRYEEALPIFREIQDRLGEANTLLGLGDLERREDHMVQAHTRYEEALPIFRDIQERMGEANTVQAVALVDSLEGSKDEAVRGFQQSLKLHEEIGNRLGMRASWVYLGQHYLRNGQPLEALLAFEESLNVLPREGDPVGYSICLRGQYQAFSDLSNVLGLLACLRMMADVGEGLEEPYTNLMQSIKDANPDTDFGELEEALSTDADGLRRNAVQLAQNQAKEGSSQE